MDPSRFDGLARGLAGFASRRGALAGLLGGVLVPLLGESDSGARKHRKPQGRRHERERARRHDHAERHRHGGAGSSHLAAEKKKKKKKCKGGTTKCGKTCVATATDAANCGACGRTCAATESCQNGVCTCDGARCAGCCASGVCQAGTSKQQCGAGGVACVACTDGRACVDGSCGCATGQDLCDGECTDVETNVNHCGSCHTSCPAGTNCQAGACTCGSGALCAPGLTCCGGACRDLQEASGHCGACNHACGTGETCSNGTCVCGGEACSTTEMCCAGICAETATDFANCGACGLGCSTVSADTCVAGECHCGGGSACGNGDTCCGGDCANLRHSPNHCGQCGRTCRSTESCCASDCVDVGGDLGNCGACGAACDREKADRCSGGACRCGTNAPCAAGLTCCGGECRDLQNDVQRCGACGTVCPGIGAPGALVTCQAGICGFTCQGNTWDADGDPATGCEAVNAHTGYDKDHAQNLGSRACRNLLQVNGTLLTDTRQHDSGLPGFNPATGSVPQWYRVQSSGGLLGITCTLPPTYKLTMTGGASGCYQLTMIVGNGAPIMVPVVGGVAAMPLLGNLQTGQIAYFGVEKICTQAINEAVPYRLDIVL